MRRYKDYKSPTTFLMENDYFLDRVDRYLEVTAQRLNRYLKNLFSPILYMSTFLFVQISILEFPIFTELYIRLFFCYQLLSALNNHLTHTPYVKTVNYLLAASLYLTFLLQSEVNTSNLLLHQTHSLYSPFIYSSILYTQHLLKKMGTAYIIITRTLPVSRLIVLLIQSALQVIRTLTAWYLVLYSKMMEFAFCVRHPVGYLTIINLYTCQLILYNYRCFHAITNSSIFGLYLPLISYFKPLSTTVIYNHAASVFPDISYFFKYMPTFHPYVDTYNVFVPVTEYLHSVGVPPIASSTVILVLSLSLYDTLMINFRPQYSLYTHILILYTACLSLISFRSNMSTIALDPYSLHVIAPTLFIFAIPLDCTRVMRETNIILFLSILLSPLHFQPISLESAFSSAYYFGTAFVATVLFYIKRYDRQKYELILDKIVFITNKILSVSHFMNITATGLAKSSIRTNPLGIGYTIRLTCCESYITKTQHFFYPEMVGATPSTPNFSSILTTHINTLFNPDIPTSFLLIFSSGEFFRIDTGLSSFTYFERFHVNPAVIPQLLNVYMQNEYNAINHRFPQWLMLKEALTASGLIQCRAAENRPILERLTRACQNYPVRQVFLTYMRPTFRAVTREARLSIKTLLLCFNRCQSQENDKHHFPYFKNWERSLFKLIAHFLLYPYRLELREVINQAMNPLITLEEEKQLYNLTVVAANRWVDTPNIVSTRLTEAFSAFSQQVEDEHTLRTQYPKLL